MGLMTSRQNIGVEEIDINASHAYKYPPKSGDNYFNNHFIMGGERFETAQPEMYLFGENMDLNFLGAKPVPFPYPAPTSGEPSRTLKSLVNIRKESLRFVRVPDNSVCLKDTNDSASTLFNIEFTFDCDVRCAITILYFCTEEVTSSGLIYTPKDPSMNSETYHYKSGANQQFSQVCHIFNPQLHPEESLAYSFDKDVFPVVIYCVAEEGEAPYQSHATIAVIEKHSDGFFLKALKQKLFVDGLCYLLQEIYGIENKNVDSKMSTDDEPDDNGAECVICMCDLRDTLILPCRHLCLCNCCADSLRYQANNCPICRSPFRALLQIKALQKLPPGAVPSNAEIGENIPQGYDSASLIEALNGPSVTPQQPVAPPSQNIDSARGTLPDKDTKVDDLEKTLPGMALNQPYRGDRYSKDTRSSDGRLELSEMSENPSLKSTSLSKLKSMRSVDDHHLQSTGTVHSKVSSEESAREEDDLSKKKWKKSSLESSVYVPFPYQQCQESVANPPQDEEDIVETINLLDETKFPNTAMHGEAQIDNDENNKMDNENSTESHFGYNKSDHRLLCDGQLSSASKFNNSSADNDSQNQSQKTGESRIVDFHSSDDSNSSSSPITDIPSDSDPPSSVAVVLVTNESQSLPGTPLSRSSDVSANSASSTKALITSNPSHFSTAV